MYSPTTWRHDGQQEKKVRYLCIDPIRGDIVQFDHSNSVDRTCYLLDQGWLVYRITEQWEALHEG